MPALCRGASKSPGAKAHTLQALDWSVWAKSQVQGG